MNGHGARHRAPRSLPRFSYSPAKAALAAAGIVAFVAVATTGLGGTFAYMSSSRTIAMSPTDGSATAVLSAGTATLTVNGDAISMTNMYPGNSRTAQFALTNTGVTSLAVSVNSISGTTAANGLTATVARGACPGTGSQVSSGSLGLTLASGASGTVCLTVAMANNAPSSAQNLSSTVGVSLTGGQP